ncbi:MAG TPA: response regulator transcription factor [Gracilimonas sp.]|uniref:response regulator n=1 Tax=Gracilimonas sp. TaxID=1974203 RepID=UPI002DA4FDE7|nr:response regulator transcription factor [Gracilimonas sp.]
MIDKIRLLIIEDNYLLREGFVDMFKSQHKLEVVVGSGDEDKFEQEISGFNPHVILLNSGLQHLQSLQVVQRVTKRSPDIKIVVMSLILSKDEIIQFMDAGAVGFIFKEAAVLEFIKTITDVAKGEIVFPLHYTNLLLSRIVSNALVKGKISHRESVQITEFELQLLKLLSEGLSDSDIGEKLAITPESVKFHLHSIKQNLYLFSLLDFPSS